MKDSRKISTAAWTLTGIGLAFCFSGCNKAPQPGPGPGPVAAKVKTNLVAEAATNQYVSVFEDLQPPAGKDPFFPDSHRRDPAPPPQAAVPRNVSVASDLLLKGIVGSASHRLAVINNEIMEIGEESVVRVPSGQVRVRCLEIGDDYVVVRVEGEAQPKRLEMAKKNY